MIVNSRLLISTMCIFLPEALYPQDVLQSTIPEAIVPEPSILCQMTLCACDAKPGEVDRCENYWNIQIDNFGNMNQIVNTNENACTLSVRRNIENLSQHFNTPFDISVPSEKIWRHLQSLSMPENSVLFPISLEYQHISNTSININPIDAAIERHDFISKHWDQYLKVSAETNRWKEALLASDRLSDAANFIIGHLAMNGDWPMVSEFAPYIWELNVCKHNNGVNVEQLSQRLDNDSTDPAHYYAFMDDLNQLIEPFESSINFSPLETIAKPFLAEPMDIVNRRKTETLFSSGDTYRFLEQVNVLNGSIKAYLDDRSSQQRVHRTAMISKFSLELAEGEELLKRADASNKLKSYNAKRSSEEAVSVVNVSTEILSNAQSEQARIIEAYYAFLQDREASATLLKQARDNLRINSANLTEALNNLELVVLQCGGFSYDNCSDEKAKIEFDKRTYQANKAVVDRRRAYTSALSAVQIATDNLLSLEKRIRDQEVLMEVNAELLVSAAQDVFHAQNDLNETKLGNDLTIREISADVASAEKLRIIRRKIYNNIELASSR